MKKIFLFAAAALSLAACDNNEDNPAILENPSLNDPWSQVDLTP